MANSQRARLWGVTLFDPLAADKEFLRDVVDRGDLTYVCGQCEICPDTQRPHFQGFLCLSQARTLTGIKRLMFTGPHLKTVHLSYCRGSKDDNVKYCSKVESRDPDGRFMFFQHGSLADVPERNGQGVRTDLHGIGTRIGEGVSLLTIAQDHPDLYIKFYRGFESIQQRLLCQPRTWSPVGAFTPPTVYWFYGSSGSGKSREAFTQAHADPERGYFTKSSGNKWFNGYFGQPILILDDFRADWFTFSFLIRLIDCYPLQVETKGGMVDMSADTVYITCPMRPEQLYAGLVAREDGRIVQLTRRITETRLFGDEPLAPEPRVPGFNPYPCH